MTPTIRALAPRVLTMNKVSRLWILSEEMCINRLTKPSIQMPAGNLLEGGGNFVMGNPELRP